MDVRNYLENDFGKVKGMSSLLSAYVCVELVKAQNETGIGGPIIEIGCFEGRMLIALVLASEATDKIFALDTFRHPDEGQLGRFRENLKKHGVSQKKVVEKKGRSIDVGPWRLKQELGRSARFIHIDGDHSYNSVMYDLMLSHNVMSKDGVICMDDVLHPYYPGLTIATHDYISNNPELEVFAVIDREGIVAASKYLICHRDFVKFYQRSILARFPNNIWRTQGNFYGKKVPIIYGDFVEQQP